MNLFYDPSVAGLRQLISAADKSLPVHNIVIDYDGEVIIDPETKFAGIRINRFKFHTRINQSVKDMKALLETLLTAYHNKGAAY